eukprot:6200150-Pleurochrysis_carterae.AAC.1
MEANMPLGCAYSVTPPANEWRSLPVLSRHKATWWSSPALSTRSLAGSTAQPLAAGYLPPWQCCAAKRSFALVTSHTWTPPPVSHEHTRLPSSDGCTSRTELRCKNSATFASEVESHTTTRPSWPHVKPNFPSGVNAHDVIQPPCARSGGGGGGESVSQTLIAPSFAPETKTPFDEHAAASTPCPLAPPPSSALVCPNRRAAASHSPLPPFCTASLRVTTTAMSPPPLARPPSGIAQSE